MDFVRRFHSLSFDHSALLNVLYGGLPSHFVCILYACVSIHILPLLFSLFGFILYEWWWCWFSQQNKRKHVFSPSKTFAKIAFFVFELFEIFRLNFDVEHMKSGWNIPYHHFWCIETLLIWQLNGIFIIAFRFIENIQLRNNAMNSTGKSTLIWYEMKWSNNNIQMHCDSNRKDSIALFYALCTFNKLLDHFKSQLYFFCLEYLCLTG